MFKLNDLELDDLLSSDISEVKEVSERDIAVIGISLKLPKAENIEEFWNNLENGIDCIEDFPAERKKDAISYLQSVGIEEKDVNFGKGAYLNSIDEFDYSFFNISPKEASLMHPNQRLFLQTVWNAIEDSGYGGKRLKGTSTGLYLGYSSAPFIDTFFDYSRFIMEDNPSLVPMAIPGNLNALIASRIAYLLDLKGPSMLIDTACSSSLVAIHTACRSIRNGECDMAIAGSIKTNLFPLENENYKLGIEASDDRAKTFDDSSDGTGKGEGVAAIILKPLSNAVKDGDNIYAVIKGSAINQDGSSVGITAPNALSQEEVISRALEDANINPETIAYIEAHGTGTKLGDPIEIAGINKAFSRYTDRKQFCAIGSVKTNIGHLDAAAGIVGLIKAILALKNKKLPPTLHFQYPNKKIDFDDSPVYVNNMLREWKYEGFPRRSGVSAFGLSGTNCHLILEEAPPSGNSYGDHLQDSHILTLSAKNKNSLEKLLSDYQNYIEMKADINLASLCYTANTGREHFNYRIAMVVESINDLKEKLTHLQLNKWVSNVENKIYFNQVQISFEQDEGNNEHHTMTSREIKLLGDEANQKIEQLSSTDKNQLEIINTICEAYVEGAEIDWDIWYRGKSIEKIPIPVYPFEKKRCWFEVSKTTKKVNSIIEDKKENYKPKIRLKGRENGIYSEREINIAEVWGGILGFNELNIEDDFYELGGDSIIATKIVNSISEITGSKIEVSSLLRYPTIKRFAEVLDNNYSLRETDPNNKLTIETAELKDYYQTSPIQKQIFAQAQFEQIGTALNTPVVLDFKGELDKDRIEASFNKLIDRHEALRTTFTFAKGELVQRIHDDVSLKVIEIKVLDDELDDVTNEQIQLFNLNEAPLARVCLLRSPDNKDRLFIDLHHIISDGVSFDILIREFMDLYDNKPLPKLNIQYKDYAVWQDTFKKTSHIKKQMNYWHEILQEDIPELKLPLDYGRKNNRSFKGKTIEFNIPKHTVIELINLTKEYKVTLNTLLFGAYTLLLNKYSNQSDIVVGTVVSGRTNAQLEKVIGAFVNLLPIRYKINPDDKLKNFIRYCNENLLKAYENQNYHYTSMIEDCNIKVDKSRNPLFDTALIFHNEYQHDTLFELDEIPFCVKPLSTNRSQLDIKLDFYSSELGELNCMLEYKTDLFSEETISNLIKHFNLILEELIAKSENQIKDISILTHNEKLLLDNKHSSDSSLVGNNLDIVLSATFTSEPIKDHILWWGNKFDMDINLKFSPYNQVFMELLEPNSVLSNNPGVNLLLIRFEDWIREDLSARDEVIFTKIKRTYNEFISIIKTKHKPTPYFIGVFPISTHLNLSKDVIEFMDRMNTQLIKDIEGLDNTYTLDYREINKLYSIKDTFDNLKDTEGHIPFTDEFYAAMGAITIRKINSWKNQNFKVIILDCDNTIWRGVCGEDGPLGVEINEHFQELQEFMVQKYNEGMLLALCSKNNESDVWEVFEKNSNMILKKKNFIDYKINWESKSENIKKIAEELNLDLSSFIFIDDNFAECSEVMTNCPEVLTLHLPEDTGQIPHYLKHVWAFDRLTITEEDKNRTDMYISEKKRQNEEKVSHTLPEFLKNLELKMSMNKAEDSQIARIAQLTKRTNQFNLSTKRMSESEIKTMINEDGITCWAIEVSDRFGDYGLVGAVITKEQKDILFIDTFLLSCRVLGRTVEAAIMQGLKEHCEKMGIKTIKAKFYPTAKNKPFLNFINKSNWKVINREETHTLIKLSIDEILSTDIIDCYYNCTYRKQSDLPTMANQLSSSNEGISFSANSKKAIKQHSNYNWNVDIINETNLMHIKYLIPLQKHSANLIVELPKELQQNNQEISGEYIAPRTEAERVITEIWEEVLGIEKISVTDNFFELGGTSLDGIQVISKISMEFEAQLNDVFEYDTIESFARNVPFSKNYLMSLLDKKEAIASSKGNNDFESDDTVKAKFTWYNKKVSKYNDVDILQTKNYENILLTGATGYLGSHLLHDILEETFSNIHVIVRSPSSIEAERRIKQKLAFYFQDSFYEKYKDRIFIHVGDLSQKFMGLKKSTYSELIKSIDCIMNSAANVSHYGRYEDSYKINVKGTEELIEFALKEKEKKKDFHHISTPLVAFGHIEGIDNFLFTEFDHYVGQEDDNVYFRTKLEAERLLIQARDKGLNTNIYRVGNLNYNTNTLKFQENISDNAFYSVVKTFLKINMIPAFEEKVIDFSFVNEVSKAITLLFNRENLRNETHHVYNYNRISSTDLGEYLQQYGYDNLEICDINELFANYQKPELRDDIMKIVIHAGLMGNIRDTNFRMVYNKTKLILEKFGFEWSEIDEKNITTMLEYSKKVQFI
ncbi:HAD-IIIC family phosphatase [Priestia aryabhattai]|uniref:HAD-IIIC family phosphatase n=1 Tax=Priestia aryabhattai TaxID=412384 RepID=UPI003D2E0D24